MAKVSSPVFIKGSISRSEIGRGALKYGGRKEQG